MTLPDKALSIRQPWAWLIVNAGKDIENRSWPTQVRGNVFIHAGNGMSRPEYNAAVLFCAGLPARTLPDNFWFPPFAELKSQCGGIVGIMRITDCVRESDSPWFCGPWGFVIKSATSRPFCPCKGALGFFKP